MSLLNLNTLVSHWIPIGHVMFDLVVSSGLCWRFSFCFLSFFLLKNKYLFIGVLYPMKRLSIGMPVGVRREILLIQTHPTLQLPTTDSWGWIHGLYRGDSCVFSTFFSSAVSAVSYMSFWVREAARHGGGVHLEQPCVYLLRAHL